MNSPPRWPYCGHDATRDDPVGCRGIHVAGYTACLAHLAVTDRAAYLATLTPGAAIDHRGTPFTTDLLAQLLSGLNDPSTHKPRIGPARFDAAFFAGDASFDEAIFTGDARFREVAFTGNAQFSNVIFSGLSLFNESAFTGDASFRGASFTGLAVFRGAKFTRRAWFDQASFSSPGVTFNGARFETESHPGTLHCDGGVALDGAVFGAPVMVWIAARWVSCVRTQWVSTATLYLRHAEVDLRNAVVEHPVTIAAHPTPFPLTGRRHETGLRDLDPGVRVTSVSGVDAAHLVLQDIDLSVCQFAGAIHLDQLRVDGWCTFAGSPASAGWYRLFPWRWSRRRTLVEEHHWRAQPGRAAIGVRGHGYPTPPGEHPWPFVRAWARGWVPPPEGITALQPAALAALYRQMRKSLEDGKNEPDAADFYYGEMEMRRHDTTRPVAERALLTAYWALSGYGLRATRALAWLVLAMSASVVALMLWGLPAKTPEPETTGRQTGPNITLTTDTPAPANPTGPWAERITGQRFEEALRVVINSVVFRSSDQDLTTAGTYTEMASRFTEPILLGLAALAIRGRVKR
ncbi:hypothetical protein GCM10022403_084060 [Streptomyces coacervatus]|uniref:Pentapeptide repeat-containing protein n=2 Tax=Streptomyces coacervatus TaxID=647381 RepID=A0ABP7JBA9_9ACTN